MSNRPGTDEPSGAESGLTAGTSPTGDFHKQHFMAAAGLLLVALLLGGANRSLNHLVVQLAALPLVYLLLRDRTALRITPMAWFVFAALGLALLQLLPLPPGVWTHLPGREQALAVLQSAGQPVGWRPVALDPGASAAALATLVAPVVLYIAVSNMQWEERRKLLAIIAIVAVVGAIIGVFQRVAGLPPVYETEHRGYSTGFFINRNHQADMIVAGVLLLPAIVASGRREEWRLPLSVIIVAMGMSVLATTSRMGLLLAVPMVLVSLALLWRPRLRYVVPAFVVYGLAVLLMLRLPALEPLLHRLSGAAGDERVAITSNTLVAMREMWPWGSGYGSFVPVYAAFEDLDQLHDRYVTAAHNDYLQILLEGGIVGLLTILAAAVLVALQAWRMLRGDVPRSAWASLAMVCVMLVHSASDFPLRMAALACVMAVCFAATDAVQHFVASRSRLP